MDLSNLITWALGLVVVVLSGAWTRQAAKVSKNADATARLGAELAGVRGRVDAMERLHGELATELRSVHQRIGGVARTTDQISGQMLQIGSTLTVIHEHLLQREKS